MKKQITKATMSLCLCISLAIFVISCGQNKTSEHESSTINTKVSEPMKYTVVLEGNFGVSAKGFVYEYTKDGDRFYQNEFSIKNGESKTFTAQKEAYKVKVYAEMWPWTDVEGWVDLVYILSEGETKVISINDNTKFMRVEP